MSVSINRKHITNAATISSLNITTPLVNNGNKPNGSHIKNLVTSSTSTFVKTLIIDEFDFLTFFTTFVDFVNNDGVCYIATDIAISSIKVLKPWQHEPVQHQRPCCVVPH
eukprot:GHVT01026361.1.p1 GENE.GHVT01026361.1~~GHVT01026361.1.p1  ORF type:complete len:110 (-),score=1.38 GHVT01026361.1:779-1108(-)